MQYILSSNWFQASRAPQVSSIPLIADADRVALCFDRTELAGNLPAGRVNLSCNLGETDQTKALYVL